MKYFFIGILFGCFFVSLTNILSRNLDQTATPKLIPVQELTKKEQKEVQEYVLSVVETIEIS